MSRITFPWLIKPKASFIHPYDSRKIFLRMATSGRIGCANCLVYDWKQVETSILQKCKRCKLLKFCIIIIIISLIMTRCKVVQYCGKACQQEHWVKVHKHHCRHLARAQDSSLHSHHPFPSEGLPGDNLEALVSLIQQLLVKMRRDKNVAFICFSRALNHLEEVMAVNRKEIWFTRKVWPAELTKPEIFTLFELQVELRDKIQGSDMWSSLHLAWRLLDDLDTALVLRSFKDPRTAAPEKFWTGLENDSSIFLAALARVIDACKTRIPSFDELLSNFCGGSLQQVCTFCSKRMTVEAISGDVKGSLFGTPEVLLRPHLAMLFNCGRAECDKEMQNLIKDWNKWRLAALSESNKHKATRCNLCFKMVPLDQIHRCEIV